jgi:hypothetical protein
MDDWNDRDKGPTSAIRVSARPGGVRPENRLVHQRSFSVNLHGEGSGGPRFQVPSYVVEWAARSRMVRGRYYEIRWRAEGLGEFKLLYDAQGAEHIVLSVSSAPGKDVRLGERYRVEVSSIRERRRSEVTGNGRG